MPMTSSITEDSGAPWGMRGTTKSWATCPIGGCTMSTRGTSRSEPTTSIKQSRSKRRKLPVLTAPTMATAATITEGTLGSPR